MIGELAALITALCFSITSTMFTLAGRGVGAAVVNRTRLVLALVLLTLTDWVLFGTPVPLHAAPDRWFWLGLSGVIGLVLGDAFLFQAFVWIGPRLSMLLMSLVPVLSTLLAWLLLAEILSPTKGIGIFVTLIGVTWVVLERHGNAAGQNEGQNHLQGILYGFGGAVGQALGLITAKVGLSGEFSPLSGTLIRMTVAAVSLWGFTLLRGQAGASIRQVLQNRRAGLFILSGSFTGPFLGVTFSLLAIQRAQVGIASTLMALTPVFLLPISYLVFGERYGWQVVLGTLVAMLGVALLFLV